jgi:hypothetical protein
LRTVRRFMWISNGYELLPHEGSMAAPASVATDRVADSAPEVPVTRCVQ